MPQRGAVCLILALKIQLTKDLERFEFARALQLDNDLLTLYVQQSVKMSR